MIDEKKIKQAAIECADEYYSLDFGKDREETNRETFVRGVCETRQNTYASR